MFHVKHLSFHKNHQLSLGAFSRQQQLYLSFNGKAPLFCPQLNIPPFFLISLPCHGSQIAVATSPITTICPKIRGTWLRCQRATNHTTGISRPTNDLVNRVSPVTTPVPTARLHDWPAAPPSARKQPTAMNATVITST